MGIGGSAALVGAAGPARRRLVASGHPDVLPASAVESGPAAVVLVLRPTPGALVSQRLEERPAGLRSHPDGPPDRLPTRVDLIVFEADGPRLLPIAPQASLQPFQRNGLPLWLRIRGLADQRRILSLCQQLQVPAELLPPLLDVPQRPRVDCFSHALLVVLHRLGSARDPAQLLSDQVGLLLLPGLLITLEEVASDESFPALTDWLLSRTGMLEDRDLDDTLHFLIDDLLDGFFPLLERIANRLDDLEEETLRQPRPRLLSSAFQYRSNVRAIRGQVWPLRHQIRLLLRQHQPLLGPEALVGFQDMADLVELLFENCELLRSQCDAITQAYAASVGNRMNQVMKTLTILTSIFAPLSFIAGIYGMNFQHMPELSWRLGYTYVLTLMLVVALVQSCWLWRRGWFQDWTTLR